LKLRISPQYSCKKGILITAELFRLTGDSSFCLPGRWLTPRDFQQGIGQDAVLFQSRPVSFDKFGGQQWRLPHPQSNAWDHPGF
jgi:hypothetical protein